MIISEILNDLPDVMPVKEVMNVLIPKININIPHRNGFIWTLIGSGGSGKTSLLLSMFKSSAFYRSKFDNIYLFIPESSFLSVEKHPFIGHDKIFHEFNEDILDSLYDELIDLKNTNLEEDNKPEYNCVIIDDFANNLKDPSTISILNKLLIKARHLNTCFIFTLQAYNYLPMILRKQITNATIFKPKNQKEFESIRNELLNMNRNEALHLFNYVFDKIYNHLDIDTNINEYRKNWNILQIKKNV